MVPLRAGNRYIGIESNIVVEMEDIENYYITIPKEDIGSPRCNLEFV